MSWGRFWSFRDGLAAALQALNANSQLTLLLVGNPDIITPLLAKADFEQRSRLQIIPAQSVIASDARPSQAIRASRGTSMRVALELVKEGRAEACVSAGNTGALMGLAKLLLKPLEGIERPALVTVLPHQQKGKTVVLDLSRQRRLRQYHAGAVCRDGQPFWRKRSSGSKIPAWRYSISGKKKPKASTVFAKPL